MLQGSAVTRNGVCEGQGGMGGVAGDSKLPFMHLHPSGTGLHHRVGTGWVMGSD